MDLRIFTEPQEGATYDDLLAVAKATEEHGFDGFFRSDHYLHMGGDGGAGPTDAWITLAGLARATSRIRLGTLVTSATFRMPGPLAIAVAQVDQMSGGRVELGLGAGWFEQEHTAYGIPFPPLGERFDRLEEQLEIITGMWATRPGKTFSHRGTHYPVIDSPALAKPVQEAGVPIIVGGSGKRRTPALAAQYAAEFNAAFDSVEKTGALFEGVDRACEAIDRDPSGLVHSAAQVVVLGDDEATLSRRAAAIGREVDELRENGLAGSADDIVAKLERFAEVGTSRVYLQVLDLADLEQITELGAEVLPRVR